MFDFNWPELLIIATVALIVIGPEDLPHMFRQLGRFTSKLRQMSREFSRAMEQAAKDTGVKDVVKDLKASTSSSALGLDAVKNAADRFEKWDPLKNAAKPTVPMPARTLVPPPMPATPPKVVTSATPSPDVVDDAAEAADDLADHDAAPASQTPASQAAAHGPATQALYDKQALRAQVLKEQTEKLKAIEAGTYATQMRSSTTRAKEPLHVHMYSEAAHAAKHPLLHMANQQTVHRHDVQAHLYNHVLHREIRSHTRRDGGVCLQFHGDVFAPECTGHSPGSPHRRDVSRVYPAGSVVVMAGAKASAAAAASS